MHISCFVPGNVIVRVQPATLKSEVPILEGLSETKTVEVPSFNLYGHPMIYLGKMNGCVNIVNPYNNELFRLPMHEEFNFDWSEGWDYYEMLGNEQITFMGQTYASQVKVPMLIDKDWNK